MANSIVHGTLRRHRRLLRAGLMGVAALLVIAVPTDIIDTPLFGREVPVRWWEYPVLAATVILTTAWFAIPGPSASQREARRPIGGVLLSVFAVGCPVCNKLVLLALGTSGALGVWAPLQPFVALIALGLLAWAVVARLRRRDCSTDECGQCRPAQTAQSATPKQ